MPRHKLTLLGHSARKRINNYLQGHWNEFSDRTGGNPCRRLAYADGVMAISGRQGVKLANEQYHVDVACDDIVESFNGMLQGYGYSQVEGRTADKCAEAHLWLTLKALYRRTYGDRGQTPRHPHRHPRHLHLWVYEIDRKMSVKEDSPCRNCRQWARSEFASVNGTSKKVD